MNGISDNAPYFYIDFNADHSVAWNVSCARTAFGGYQAGQCTDAPTLMSTGMDSSKLPAEVGTFSLARFGGYVISGGKYETLLCFGGVNCKLLQVYAVNEVHQDNWLFNTDASYGLIGLGPRSYIWEGFVSPLNKTATYSIELDRLIGFNQVDNNITFGGAGDAYYSHYMGMPNLTV